MLPNSKTRILNAIEDLTTLLSEHDDNEELKTAEEWKIAEATLAEATAFVETIWAKRIEVIINV